MANAGGHLQELFDLFPRFDPVEGGAPTWVTFDTPQAALAAGGPRRSFTRLPHPRDLAVTARHAVLSTKIARAREVLHVVSTGSSIALPFSGRRTSSRCIVSLVDARDTPERTLAYWSHSRTPAGRLGLLPGDNLG